VAWKTKVKGRASIEDLTKGGQGHGKNANPSPG
jgi:hypothetical protein